MRAIVLASTALTFAVSASAQTVAERLDKARTEVNTVENAAARAQTAIKAGNLPKATLEINATKNAASRALYAIDKALEAVKPPLPPLPQPTDPDPVIVEPVEPTVPVTPAPEPEKPNGYVLSPSPDGLPEIEDGLSIQDLTIDVSKYAHTTAAPDVVGAFRMDCEPGQVNADDPLVYFGQEGAAHPHGWYGNTGGNAHSTYESLRTTGDSTCLNPLNRSAYWAPTMMDPVLKVVFRVDHTKLYYKRRPKSDPLCSKSTSPNAEGECIPVPNGLRFIFGYDMVSGETPKDSFSWKCSNGAIVKAISDKTWPTLTEAMAVCPVGARVSAALKAPSCWNPKYLDTPNHRDHMAYMVRNSAGFNRCPDTHPMVVPGLTLMQIWEVTPELKASSDAGNLGVSSDFRIPGAKRGSTYHGDVIFAWKREVMLTFVENCINKLFSCSSGDLGNGRMLKNLSRTKFLKAPQVVPLPVSHDAN